MKTNKFFNKWWLMLVHGILLIFLSYFLFNQADKLISASGIIAGFIALLTGSVSIIGYFLAGKNEKNRVELFAGLFSCIAGLFFLSGTSLAHELTAWFFAIYMLFNAIMLVITSWQLRTEINWWWFSLILFIYTSFVLYLFIAGVAVLEVSLPVFAAVQFFTNGMLIITLAFVVRKLQFEYSRTIDQLLNRRMDK